MFSAPIRQNYKALYSDTDSRINAYDIDDPIIKQQAKSVASIVEKKS